MASSGNINDAAYIVIKHGNRRRLLSKPATFEALMSRACEIFEFAPNTQVCAYFEYRNHLDSYVEMELDPTAYHFIKTGDELEWKCFEKSPPKDTKGDGAQVEGGDGPCYLGSGPASVHRNANWGGFEGVPGPGSVASVVPSSMRGYGSTPKHEWGGDCPNEGKDEAQYSSGGWSTRAPNTAVRPGHGQESDGGGWGSPLRRGSWGEDVFTASNPSVGGGGDGGDGDGDGASMWLRPMPRGPLPERQTQTRWAPETSPRHRRHQGREAGRREEKK